MTREEAIEMLKKDKEQRGECFISDALDMAIKALEQEPSRDMEEISEVLKCDADAETKCKMISNILNAKPHYFEKQEPSGDLISRQAFITRYDEWMYSEYGHHAREDALGLRVIKSLPPVKQEPKLRQALEQEKGAYNALARDCIPMSVIEDIKTDIEKAIEDFYYDEHDLGVKAGFRFALEIIDNHISGKESE